MEYLGRAMARTGSLVNELAAISSPLAEIASRTISSQVDGGKPAVQELEAVSGNAGFMPAGNSAAGHTNTAVTPMSDEAPAGSACSGGSSSGSSQGSAAGEKSVNTANSMVGNLYVMGENALNAFDRT